MVTSALRAATHVIALCAPTPVEFERLRVLWPPLEEVGALAEVPPQVAVLLVRTVAGAASTTDYRDVMAGDGSLAPSPARGTFAARTGRAGWPWANAARPTSRRDAWGSRWPSSARSSRSRYRAVPEPGRVLVRGMYTVALILAVTAVGVLLA